MKMCYKNYKKIMEVYKHYTKTRNSNAELSFNKTKTIINKITYIR